MKRKMGLLVMAYGTPYKEEDIERYYTHIRRGKKPSPEMLEDLEKRYKAIGGISPLAGITVGQAEKLEDYLNSCQSDIEFKMYLGLKHIEPFIEDAVKKMHEDGIKEAISIVLAPHFSTFSIESYNNRAKEAADSIGGPNIVSVESWYNEPKFIQYWTDKVNKTFSQMENKEREKAVVIFSAHSLPEKIIKLGDPYPEQIEETARLIANKAGLTNYACGWQSAGNTNEPWLGPDVQELTHQLYKENGYTAFVYLPIGFVSEHLEVLYDNDVECKNVTDKINASYFRPEMPDTNPLFIEALAAVILKKLEITV